MGAVTWSESRSVVSYSLWPHGLYSPWNSSGQNTEVSSLSLLQGIFPTQGSNPGLLHCRQILYQLSHKGSPRILEWVAYSFSSGSSWHWNWTGAETGLIQPKAKDGLKSSEEAWNRFSPWAFKGTRLCQHLGFNLLASIQTILQSYSNQNSMVLALRQIYGLMGAEERAQK